MRLDKRFMTNIWKWYDSLSKRIKDSIAFSAVAIGSLSTILSILGVSLNDWQESTICKRIEVVIIAAVVFFLISYIVIGMAFKNSVDLEIRQTPVCIKYGDIFNTEGLRVIGCDTHFDTRIDDVHIAKNSLHGQLMLEHGKKEEIIEVINGKAKELKLSKNKNGLYSFPLGTIIRYDSSVDNNTYLLLALNELDSDNRACTTMPQYEQALMKMWDEIDIVYAGKDIVLPLLGGKITRFKNIIKDKKILLRCMLCTLNSTGITYSSQIKIILFNDSKDILLYEFKDAFKMFPQK